jgi:hypothetical protein
MTIAKIRVDEISVATFTGNVGEPVNEVESQPTVTNETGGRVIKIELNDGVGTSDGFGR